MFELESVLTVNLMIAINMVNAVPMTFLCIWLYSRYSAAKVLRCVITLMLIGSIVRASCYKTDEFWPVVVGSYLCSCCNAFFINVQAIIANKWFKDNERAIATAI